MMKRIMILSVWAMVNCLPAGHTEENTEGNKGYIFGSPKEPVMTEAEVPQEKRHKPIKPHLMQDLKKADSWIERNLW